MILLFALLLAAEPAAASPEPLIADCEAHQFQTIVHVTVAGKPRSSKVKLCGKTGQTDAEWLHTLKDAIEKVRASESMSAEAKDQVIAALNVELARLTPAADTSPPPATVVALPPASTVPPPPPPFVSAPVGGPVEYSALPPLPAPLPAASSVMIAASAPPPLPAPRLTLRCLATNTVSAEGPCDPLEQNMVLTVRADEDVARGTSLRFLRRGDNRAEVALLQLRRGQTQRFALPANVCKGVAGSRVEIQVIRAAGSSTQVVDTRGPYDLRC
ncbi:MAG TPA: hypothetical protein VKC17_08605 [Sphingomicrobium sp.]|nr:hypothetical protein [Sphingomicrobium sp.]